MSVPVKSHERRPLLRPGHRRPAVKRGPDNAVELIEHLQAKIAELERVNASSLETLTTQFLELERLRRKVS